MLNYIQKNIRFAVSIPFQETVYLLINDKLFICRIKS